MIAQGVSDEEAIDLTSLTPEICRLMAAVEEIYSEFTAPTKDILEWKMTMAEFAIRADRQLIIDHHLTRHDAQLYIDHFKKISEQDNTTMKGLVMGLVLVRNRNRFGQTI